MRQSGFGKKGGTSTNAGRKSTAYRATLPDGRVVKKRSFQVNQETAVMGCYQDREGNWHVSGIASEPQDWGRQIFIEAQRVDCA